MRLVWLLILMLMLPFAAGVEPNATFHWAHEVAVTDDGRAVGAHANGEWVRVSAYHTPGILTYSISEDLVAEQQKTYPLPNDLYSVSTASDGLQYLALGSTQASFLKLGVHGDNRSALTVGTLGLRVVSVFSQRDDRIYAALNSGPNSNVVMRLDKDLTPIWNFTISSGYTDLLLSGIVADENSVYAIGSATSPVDGFETYLVKLSSNGIYQWNRSIPNINLTEPSIALNSVGEIYFAGNARANDSVLAVKYTEEGKHLWNSSYSFTAGIHTMNGTLIGIDEDDHIYLAGSFDDPGEDEDIFLLEIDKNGNHLWNATYDHGINAVDDFNDQVFGLSISGNRDIYLAGRSEDISDDNVSLVLKFGRVWSHSECEFRNSQVSVNSIVTKYIGSLQPCFLESAYVNSSTLNSTTSSRSALRNVSGDNSVITDSDLTGLKITDSTITSTNVSCNGLEVIGGTVQSGILTAGLIKYRNTYYPAPYTVSNICLGLSPFTYAFTLTPSAIAFGGLVELNVLSTRTLSEVQGDISPINGSTGMFSVYSGSTTLFSGGIGLFTDIHINSLGEVFVLSLDNDVGEPAYISKFNSTLTHQWSRGLGSGSTTQWGSLDSTQEGEVFAFVSVVENGSNEDAAVLHVKQILKNLSQWSEPVAAPMTRGGIASNGDFFVSQMNTSTEEWTIGRWDSHGNIINYTTFDDGAGSMVKGVLVDKQRNDAVFAYGASGDVGSQNPKLTSFYSSGQFDNVYVSSQFGGASVIEDASLTRDGGIITLTRNMSGRDFVLSKHSADLTLEWNMTFFFEDSASNGVVPMSLAVDEGSQVIYVLRQHSSGGKIEKFAANGTYIGGKVLDTLSFTSGPHAIEAHEGNLYVSGINGNDVQVYRLRLADALGLRDDGGTPDSSADDGLWSGHIISKSRENGTTTLYAHLFDGSGNRYPISTTLTLDNAPPNTTLRINGDDTSVNGRATLLDIQAIDNIGVLGCRFGNYNLSDLLFSYLGEDTPVGSSQTGPVAHLGTISEQQYDSGVAGRSLTPIGPNGAYVSFNNTGEVLLNRTRGSLEFWVSPQWSPTGTNTLLSSAWGGLLGNRSQGITVYRNDSTIVAAFTDTGTGDEDLLTASITWVTGTWHHIALTWDVSGGSGPAVLYLDGSEAASGTISNPPSFLNENLTLGYGFAEETHTFANASIDQVAVYGHVFSSQEVQDYFNLPTHLTWIPCPSQHSWLLTNGTGNKTVWLQSIDIAGNVGTDQDSIEVFALGLGDQTAPFNLTVRDDGNFTKSSNSLHAVFEAIDTESEVHYRVRLRNSTAILTSWFETNNNGVDNEYTFVGLNLIENTTYFIEVEALNSLNDSITAMNDGITTDFTQPGTPSVNASFESQTWIHSESVQFFANVSDDISGIEGLSYTISESYLAPDAVVETIDMKYPFPLTFPKWNASIVASSSGDWEYTLEDMTSDSSSIYLIGSNRTSTNTHQSCFIAKFNTDGVQQWNNTYLETGSSEGSICTSGIIKSNGDLIVSGQNYSGGRYVPLLMGVSASGSRQWVKSYEVPVMDTFYEVELDGGENIYVSSNYTLSNLPTSSGAAVLKFSGQGVPIWNTTFSDGSGNFTMESLDIYSSSIIGAVHDQTAAFDMYQLGLDLNGELLWNSTYDAGGVELGLSARRARDVNIFGGKNGSQSLLQGRNETGSLLWSTIYTDTIMNTVNGMTTFDDKILTVSNNSNCYFHITRDDGVALNSLNISATSPIEEPDVSVTTDGDVAIGFVEGDSVRTNLSIHFYEMNQSKLYANTTLNLSNIADGEFIFRVSALDFAKNLGPFANYTLWKDSTPSSIPQFLGNDTIQQGNFLDLSWTESADTVSGVATYFVRVDNNSDFSSPEYEDNVGNVTSSLISMGATDTWYASVRARNGAGLNSSWSNTITKVIDQAAPTVTVQYPPAASTVSTLEPTLRLSTNENANCKWTFGSRTYNFLFTGGVRHETIIPVAILPDSSAITINFQCFDIVGNEGSSSVGFNTDTNVVVDSVIIQTPVADAFLNSPANVSVQAQAGVSNVVGLTTNDIIVQVDGDTESGIGIYEESAGRYNIFFQAPPVKGNYSITVLIGSDSDTQTLEVLPARVYVQYSGESIANTKQTDYAIMNYNSSFSVGFASESDKDEIIQSQGSSLFSLGSLTDDYMYIFTTKEDAENLISKKERFMRDKNFLDEAKPTFGLPNKLQTYTLVITSKHPKVQFAETKAWPAGQYEAQVANYGRIGYGDANYGKFNFTFAVD